MSRWPPRTRRTPNGLCSGVPALLLVLSICGGCADEWSGLSSALAGADPDTESIPTTGLIVGAGELRAGGAVDATPGQGAGTRAEATSPQPSPSPEVAGITAIEPGNIRLYWDLHGEPQYGRSLEIFASHPDLEGVIVRPHWWQVEPARGQFDFSALEAAISWWAARGKQVIIRNAVFVPDPHQPPEWLYDFGVEAIVYEPRAAAEPRRVPRVWDSPEFEKLLDEYVQALAERYDGDPRVAYVWAGVGHLGYTTADASPGGDTAFREAGWTPEKWEEYIRSAVDIYASHFVRTPTLLATSPLWLRSHGFDRIAPAMSRLAVHAVEHGASLFLNGLDPAAEEYAQRPFSEMLDSLASTPLPPYFAVFVGDDWSLWVDEERREESDHQAERDEEGFRAALDTALQEWERLERRSDLILVLLKPELSATNPNDPAYRPEVRAVLTEFLNAE